MTEEKELYLINWKEDTTFTDKEGVGIHLARGESKTYVLKQMEEDCEEEQITKTEAIAGWTDAFIKIFENSYDEEVVEGICYQIERDLIYEAKDLTRAVTSVLDNLGLLESITEPLEIVIDYVLDEDNEIVIVLNSNIEDVIDPPQEDREKVLNMIDGVFMVYGSHYGIDHRREWTDILFMGLEGSKEVELGGRFYFKMKQRAENEENEENEEDEK